MSGSVRRLIRPIVGRPSIEFIDLKEQRRRLGAELDEAIQRVLDHGRYIMGPEVAELEEKLTARTGARNAITCSSGSDALVLTLMAMGIGSGDVVLLPSFTFVATVEAVVLAGAIPFFVEVDPSTLNVDVDSLRALLTDWSERRRPRALIAVDLFGRPCDYDRLSDLASDFDFTLISDAAQSFGAKYGGRSVGTLASATTTSFFPAKPLGAYGDGGAVFTDDDSLAERLRSIRVHGSGAEKYEHVTLGLNARLDTLQAAVLLVKLNVFDEELRLRETVARTYNGLLSEFLETPPIDPGISSNWAQYTVQTDFREVITAALRARGIPTAVYYPVPLHRQRPYASFPRAGTLGVSELAAARVLSLPMHPYVEHGQQEELAVLVRDALASLSP